MEEYLFDNGFVEGKYPKEYTRGTWTIRLDHAVIEVFDELAPDGSGSYFLGASTWENLENILEDIDSYEEFGNLV